MAVIGIDLGTTNSLAVCWRNGKAEIIANSMGLISTPSVVSVDDSGEILVGAIAKERLISHPKHTAAEFKRSMGTRQILNLDGKNFTPEELSALVLKKLKADAEAFLGETVDEAVISVPAYFDDNCRNATKLAAELAGIKADRLVNEPSAAALAYLAGHNFRNGTFMIVDFGGGTLDISIVDAYDSVIEILAVAGNNHLGGKDFNEAIARYFCSLNNLNYDTISDDARAIIYKSAENCKHALTTMPMAMMAANINGKEISASLDNHKLIEISAGIFAKIGEPIKRALHDSKVPMKKINDIILVGGSCRMPTVRAFIEEITGIAPCSDVNPDTAIAVGAGIFAAIKDRNEELRDVILTDICPFSLGISTLEERTGEVLMDFIIERNTTLPASRTHSYAAVHDNQDHFTVRIYQGESMLPGKNLLLGELEVKCPTAMKNEPLGSVRMTYDINGILVVDVITLDGNVKSKVLLSKSSTLSEKEVETCRKQMEKLTLSPVEKEENRMLIARAERVFEESFAEERAEIHNALTEFKVALKHGNNRNIREIYERLERILDRIDS